MNGPLHLSKQSFSARDIRSGGPGVWMDDNYNVGALTRGPTAPDLVALASTGILLPAFNGVNTLEAVHGVTEMNHNWQEGTIIRPHIHWLPTTADAGNVRWNLEYLVSGFDEVDGAADGTVSIVQATNSTAWENLLAIFPSIDLTGVLIAAQFAFRLYRDPTDGDDTYGADAMVKTVGLHILIDTLGSREIFTK